MRKHRPHINRRRGRPQKSPRWIDYKVDTRELLDRFLCDAIKFTWTGRLGTRQASAVNGSIRLLMELRGWRQLPPMTLPQDQAPGENYKEKYEITQKLFSEFLAQCPEEVKRPILDKWTHQIEAAMEREESPLEISNQFCQTLTEEEQVGFSRLIKKYEEWLESQSKPPESTPGPQRKRPECPEA